MKTEYQKNYASKRVQMYDRKSREKKALRIIKTLEDFLGKGALSKIKVLDVGASTGIIDNVLAKKFGDVIGTDIDKGAIEFALMHFKSRNLHFRIEDAMKLSFRDETFDVIICTHVYEHVPDPKKLFKEIYRVLKPGGVCYLAAINKLWPMEPHYNLPFLSWLPKDLANSYVKLLGKADKYYETPLSYWGILNLVSKFRTIDFTGKILRNPRKYGYEDKITPGLVSFLSFAISPAAKFLAPTFFWLLKKEK